MAREPYDYKRERQIAAYVLTALIVVQIVSDVLVPDYRADPANLALNVGGLFGVVGLGALLRRLR